MQSLPGSCWVAGVCVSLSDLVNDTESTLGIYCGWAVQRRLCYFLSPDLLMVFVGFETESYYVVQAGLKLVAILLPLPPPLPSAGIIRIYHHAC